MTKNEDKKLSTVQPHRLFVLRFQDRRQVQEVHFWWEGTLSEAITRGRTHCEVMNYKFIQVRPFTIDLDLQEQHRAENRANYDD